MIHKYYSNIFNPFARLIFNSREEATIKSLLVAVNAKYIHTNPAVKTIAAYSLQHFNRVIALVEYSINQRSSDVLYDLYRQNADIYLFSCYIWNISFIKEIIGSLKKVLPGAVIVLGGPEASWQAKALLQELSQVDYIVTGEGELRTNTLIDALESGSPADNIGGVISKNNMNNNDFATDEPALLNLAEIPFIYNDLDSLAGKILYYESMRGCPFSCSYCLSSIDKTVRFKPLDIVYEDLLIFIGKKVPQVKFVDRTFNCNKQRALKIWQFLHEHDNGHTNFHFEIAGDLFDEDSLSFLKQVREGLFQFEIGVQSTNLETLNEIDRSCDFTKLRKNVALLSSPRNIHLHLDLIAGLPFESYERFKISFNDVYSLAPHQLQLGFLKVLGGSKMHENAEKYAIQYTGEPPYEALCTKWITYEEMHTLHGVDEMVDTFYNSGRFDNIVQYILGYFASPFEFYKNLWDFYDSKQQGLPISKIGYYDILGGFMHEYGIPADENAQWICKFDLLLHEKPRKLPNWVTADLSALHKSWLYPLRRKLPSHLWLEVFPFLPSSVCAQIPESTDAYVIEFDYQNRSITGRAKIKITTLEQYL